MRYAGLLLLLHLASRPMFAKLRSAWIRLGNVLGAINTFLLLTLVYVILVIPIGLIRRIVGQRSQAKNNRCESFWQSPKEDPLSSLKNQF